MLVDLLMTMIVVYIRRRTMTMMMLEVARLLWRETTVLCRDVESDLDDTADDNREM